VFQKVEKKSRWNMMGHFYLSDIYSELSWLGRHGKIHEKMAEFCHSKTPNIIMFQSKKI